MSIQLSAKKEQTGYDIVHNSQNTSAVTAQRILNTTPEQANMDYLLDYLIENFAKIPVNVEIASEYRYKAPIITKETLVIIISQSGETADSLAALRMAKKLGKGKTVVTVLPDTGERYFSTELFEH